MTDIQPLQHLDPRRFETPAILKRLASASRQLAELKGVAASIPNQGILINTLGMQEAKDSSAIENIVTTDDELFQEDLFPDQPGSPAAKEVLRFSHPYTKIQFIQRDLGVSRLTATKYLDALATDGVLRKEKVGRSNYYINHALVAILAGEGAPR